VERALDNHPRARLAPAFRRHPRMRGVMAFAAGALLLLAGSARPDEGMWLLTSPPNKLLKQRHDFEPTADWLAHLQKSSVRFGAGGAATVGSPPGPGLATPPRPPPPH